jgi:nucleotide-binding universal stress UspA family protein
MARRILVPLDRTARAEQALKALPTLAEKGDEVILLSIEERAQQMQRGVRPGRIVRGPVGGPAGGVVGGALPDLPVYAETSDQAMQRQLDEMEGYMRPKARDLENQGYRVSMAFEISDAPADAIVDFARQCKPTFILMSRTTKPGIGQRVFGTVAQHVIRADVAPVMIVPNTA